MPSKTKKIIVETETPLAVNPLLPEKPQKFFNKNILVVLSCLTVIFIFAAVFFAIQNSKLKQNLKESLKEKAQPLPEQTKVAVSSELSDEQIVAAAAKLIILPRDEQPTVATVGDLEKLKGKAFFENAELGDKVLIYTQAQKAVLFRQSENKIVAIAPINTNLAEHTQSKTISLEIRNGSGKTGAAAGLKTLLENTANFKVIKTGNTTLIYEKTILLINPASSINADKKNILLVKTQGQLITTLPKDEPPTTADILIILGKN